MRLKATPESAIAYMKFIVVLLFSWPPSPKATKREIFLFEIGWWISLLISIFLIIPLGYAAYSQRENILAATRSVCIAIVCLQYVVKMLICRSQRKRFQLLLYEMENFVKNAENYERYVLTNYIERVSFVIVIFNITSLSASLGVICGPLVLAQPLPTDAKYPFEVENHPTLGIIYILQSIAGLQCCSITFTDCQISMMIWFMVARCDLLVTEMKEIKNMKELHIGIAKHQYLLWYIDELQKCVRYILLTSILMTMLSIIFGSIHIIGNVPIVIKLQFVIVDLGMILLLFMTAWPASSLMHTCEQIGWSLYRPGGSKDFYKTAMIIFQRAQKPPIIAVGGILPALSLNYYATFLSKTFSFFTTLHVMLSKMDENI